MPQLDDTLTDPVEAERLLAATGRELDALLTRAAAMRDAGLAAAGRPGVVTYSRKVFLPLTTLCRDRCHYCAFVDTPAQLLRKKAPAYLDDAQILRIARAGAAQGCKEALLTLGDRPEDRWPEARAWLDAHGFASTIDYVAHAARLVTAETGLLAHANPGVMSADELAALRPVSPSMGMMLETTSRALFETPGAAHFGSPDKDPELRLAVIEDAGRARIPFTTGILVGIGETRADRAASLFALRDSHARHGHVQEVIVQNFRAKPSTAMQGKPDAGRDAYLAAIAVARLVLGPDMRIQAPPNLSDPGELASLLAAGIDDWGGVSPLTADHVNPERPWPHVDDLAAHTAAAGFELVERLTAHPEYLRSREGWIDPALHAAVAQLADPSTGLARQTGVVPSRRRRGTVLLETAASTPRELDAADWEHLLTATGDDLERLVRTADDVRRTTIGDTVSLVVNRNLASSGLHRLPVGPGAFDLADAGAIAWDAASLGATELCIQGRLDHTEDPALYVDLVRAVRAAAPSLHLHAFRPQDVADLADRTTIGVRHAVAALRDAGVGTMPGTGVKVLDDDIRRRIAPEDLEVDRWLEIVRTEHTLGMRTSSVLFYGHVESAADRVAHLLTLRGLQDETGGFTEFVPIPLPGGGARVADRSELDEHRAMVAVARLLLNDGIRHIQIPWTRHGRAVTAELLRSGGDDLGGTLLDGRVRPDAGVEQGLELPFADASRLAGSLRRRLRERTTVYGTPAEAAA
ncbi:7,8-didemethyl-8-hydroxy-5-deazariboflavin synthase CofG [Microbacterium oleivorans]|uniref:7,8-didemethyl-8-hydroxy-5-deazariboflavin synthase CofG n=1 Tax=Microbacterium oleivorans TaxID=273677 RepID=UPI00203F75E7|nr:7,8-didemethyl-8-hydroxy-5-deazariboflavin synthase CofG [Microbacterium oleivorans]MCM3695539.1 7,8-didemethyl-8-hydroxy-5-deazariboflavin synthase CofG [Microbacterium oleivorans]